MEPIPEHINKTITIKQALTVAVSVIAAAAASLVWVGRIEARVDVVQADNAKIMEKIEQISEDTAYMRGVIDSERGKRK